MEELKSNGQNIEIIDRKVVKVNQVEEVLSSTEKEVFVKVEKDILQILGDGLKIIKLVPEDKVLVVSGKVNGLMFSSKLTKKSLLGRVFK